MPTLHSVEYPREHHPYFLGRHRFVPAPFVAVAQMDDPEVELRLAIDMRTGVPEVREVTFRSIGTGRAIRASDLRVKLNDLLEDAVALAARVRSGTPEWPDFPPEFVDAASEDGDARDDQDWRTGQFAREAQSEAERLETRRLVARARKSTRRKMTTDFLREVAEVYRANVHDRPTRAIRVHFNLPPATASHYVRMARDAGHLGPALVGKAGEKA